MPMTHIPLSGLEIETDSISSKTSTLQDIISPSVMSNTQRDILQIIRKEEDHAMSLLTASPLLSSLFLTYANRAATLDGPQAPSPIDVEWTEMKTLNSRLQEEIAVLQAQLNKETERAKTAEDCVEALRAQLSSVKDANHDLKTAVSKNRIRLEAITSEYVECKKEAEDTIAELRVTVDREASARAALSQVIADQQITIALLQEQNTNSSQPPAIVKERPAPLLTRLSRISDTSAPAKNKVTTKQIDADKQEGDTSRKDYTDQPDDKNQDTTKSRSTPEPSKQEKKDKPTVSINGPVTNKTNRPGGDFQWF
ncbi:hypothetical protein BDM02DRAFT_3262963 [Thelephora ganbajun]|uniref:Uncharacterized protein n=1 Tax=Thelephora ganbajun TaxID=370292 RepID=A0ACB6Z720_THEGA|nr:hypothetical protein BDM02DRAFT_3262963 [Thelephora ganbajun]